MKKILSYFSLILIFLSGTPATALIISYPGNQPLLQWQEKGLPLGAAEFANLPTRIGYSEGPPFGGGEYVFLYRCQKTEQFNEALKTFAAIATPRLELVVHDGPEYDPIDKTRIDWIFIIWTPENWYHLYSNPKSVFSSDGDNFRKPVPPPTIDVYIGGESPIAWKQVKIPDNIQLIDKRAESSPIKPVGGGLIRGQVYDMATGRVIEGASVILANREGSNGLKELISAKTGNKGSFEIEKIPIGRCEILIRAEGYVSRKYGSYDNKGNTYYEFIAELIRESSIKGIVIDLNGKPIPGIEVSARDTLAINGLGYQCVDLKPATTDGEGRFEIYGLPQGFTLLRCRAPLLRQAASTLELYAVSSRLHPTRGIIRITMVGTGIVRVQVVGIDGKPPSDKIFVRIEQAEGLSGGQYGGVKDCQEDGTCEFKEVPPGEYLVSPGLGGWIKEGPNAKLVIVKSGETVDVKIVKEEAKKLRNPKR